MYAGLTTVRFGDIDEAGIVYYPRFFHYFHVVYEDFLSEKIIPLHVLLGQRRVGFPVVNIQAAFLTPLFYGDVCPVELFVTKVGRSSVCYHYRLFRPNGMLSSEAIIHTACMDIDTQRSIPIPDDIRTGLEGLLEPPPAWASDARS